LVGGWGRRCRAYLGLTNIVGVVKESGGILRNIYSSWILTGSITHKPEEGREREVT
jgi:hypothetical protein